MIRKRNYSIHVWGTTTCKAGEPRPPYLDESLEKGIVRDLRAELLRLAKLSHADLLAECAVSEDVLDLDHLYPELLG